jgi:hypothetical protein
MFEAPPAIRPFLLALTLLGLGVYLFFGGLALVEAQAPAAWAEVLVPVSLGCFAAAAVEVLRVARSLPR